MLRELNIADRRNQMDGAEVGILTFSHCEKTGAYTLVQKTRNCTTRHGLGLSIPVSGTRTGEDVVIGAVTFSRLSEGGKDKLLSKVGPNSLFHHDGRYFIRWIAGFRVVDY